MLRKKLTNPENILSKPIIGRVTEAVFKRLEKLRRESDCGSVGEVARKINFYFLPKIVVPLNLCSNVKSD